MYYFKYLRTEKIKYNHEQVGWENTREIEQLAALQLIPTKQPSNQPNAKLLAPSEKTHMKKMNLLRSLFPWQHRIVLMMFLPSRQAGLGRITAQIGSPWLVTKGGFKMCKGKERERGADGWKNCHFEENPNPHSQLGSAILIWMDRREET